MNAATIIYTIRGSVLEAEGFDAIVSLVAIPPTKLEAPQLPYRFERPVQWFDFVRWFVFRLI